jgi:hypothetical protein
VSKRPFLLYSHPNRTVTKSRRKRPFIANCSQQANWLIDTAVFGAGRFVVWAEAAGGTGLASGACDWQFGRVEQGQVCGQQGMFASRSQVGNWLPEPGGQSAEVAAVH